MGGGGSVFISRRRPLACLPLSFPFIAETSPASPPRRLFPLHYIFLTSPGIKNNSLVPPNSPCEQFKTIILNNDNHERLFVQSSAAACSLESAQAQGHGPLHSA